MIEDLSAVLEDGVPSTIVVSKECIALAEIERLLCNWPIHHVVDINGWRALKEAAATYEGVCW
jgi:hypothetical protein